MYENKHLPVTDKSLIINYIKSMLELHSKHFEDFSDKIRNMFYIIHKSDEVALYIHNEVLKCSNQVIGYTGTLILYYRTDNYWETIPSHVVSNRRETCMEGVIKALLAQVPENISN